MLSMQRKKQPRRRKKGKRTKRRRKVTKLKLKVTLKLKSPREKKSQPSTPRPIIQSRKRLKPQTGKYRKGSAGVLRQSSSFPSPRRPPWVISSRLLLELCCSATLGQLMSGKFYNPFYRNMKERKHHQIPALHYLSLVLHPQLPEEKTNHIHHLLSLPPSKHSVSNKLQQRSTKALVQRKESLMKFQSQSRMVFMATSIHLHGKRAIH
mmetsp:Transcript_9684/g.22761  ORF Transcript_9684/g.22761 Transcript_9684/m.22761 type:complete len:208 (-) Transcript_9684:632-1255(-)